MNEPKIALTMGDVAGVGPEVVLRACCDPRLHGWCRPVVIGNPQVLLRAAELIEAPLPIVAVDGLDDWDPENNTISCWNPNDDAAADVPPGTVDPRAGRAAYECLVAATQAALAGTVDAITTAPLNKAALRQAGYHYPGQTEILAELCGVNRFAMMLYLPRSLSDASNVRDTGMKSPFGLGVAHVTLHTSIRSVPDLLSAEAVQQKIELVAEFLRNLGCGQPRIAVCALNPHAGEGGLFGDEEGRIIAPAVTAAQGGGIDVTGPLPADTLLKRAVAGEFDGVVAMYHDQGHIALKLIGFERAVNVTLGLPIVRTSPSHGTAFDIAWQGRASAEGMLEAIRVAAMLSQRRIVNQMTP